ncbi:MAG: hypothetical protein FWD96_05870, partial [Defluviitaleaceae bacterium]|nr:hypothetical protein [Defluviitaleaceae bacterium]
MSHKTKHKKNRPDYRRIAAAVLAILIALVMVLGLFQPLFASERPDVAITDGQIGFNRMYRMGGYTPFIVTLENSGNADFEGILRIMVDVSHIERERSFVSYSREVRLSAGEQRTIETIIPLVTHRRTHRAVLVDNSGNTIASRTIFASAVDTHQVMAGMLTDNRQAASRMRWLRLDDQAWEASIINQRLVFLDETNFPSSIQTLNGFNIIIADDFNPAHLSQTQLDALNKWVLEGGVAAFGSTGGFERSFLQGLSGEPINDTHNTIYGATYNSFIYSHGLGTVIIHEFPLVYGTVHDSFPGEGLLSYLYRRHIIMNTTPIARFATETLMLTENLPSFNSPQLPIIMIIVGVYALAIGSVLYVLLKKRDKRELAIYIIPAAAVGVTAVISIIGLGSGYQEPITSTVTRLTLSGEGTSAVAESVTGVHSPSSGDITVVLANDAPLRFEAMQHWGIMPLDPSRSSARVTERNEADIRIGPNGEISNITYLNRASWDGGHFSQTSDVELAGELQGNFRFEGSTLVGTLRNNTGLDLYDVIVGVASTFERHDFLANGHELEISMALSAALPFFSHWNIVEEVFPFRGLGHDTTPEEGRNLQFKRDVMNTLLSGNTLSPVFSPITRSPVSTDSTVTTADEQAGLRLLPDEQRWMLQDEPYTYRDIVYG